ncbi:uncharacterized protein [Montipora foliosa]|uniref:uncharacterized protein isoform X2 n=1 Tax=Montipora foliosa TaxID=591990 RepID=UPI0035F14C5E
MTMGLLLSWLIVCFVSGFAQELNRAVSTNGSCESVVKELARHRHPHMVVRHCCNYTKVIYHCINGYRIEDAETMQRCKDGRLTGRLPECRFPKVTSCGNPGTIRHGYFVGSDFNVGNTVEYRCTRGYKLHGSALSKCKKHGTWTQRPLCVEKNVMDVNEATAFIRHNLIDKNVEHLCSKNGSCSIMEQRKRRSLDLDYSGGLDVIFLVDGSNGVSKEDYRIGLKFAQELIRVLAATIPRGDIRVAVVSYNSKPYTSLNFASPSDRVIKKIGSLKKPGGCGTSLGRAIYMTRRRVVPNTRTNSNKAMFVISTGVLNIGTSHPKAARLLESEKSFQVFAIAIGKTPNKRLLSSVVSQPEKSHVIFLRYYGDVFDAVRRTVITKKRGPTECGISVTKPRSRNVRGNKATSGVWPWQINIYWDGSLVCNGALIHKEWVITAAHCFYSKTWRPIVRPASRYTIKAGGHHLGDRKTSPEQIIEASKIFIHDNYERQSHENDIALVKLDRTVKLGKYVSLVCLPEMNEDLAVPGKHGFVAGWGEKQKNSKKDKKSKQSRKKSRSEITVHIALAISPNKVCKNSTKEAFNSTVMFCAGGGDKPGKHSCRGDGGGPFLRERYDSRSRKYRWTVAGLVSWGDGCGVKGRYNFFTRVAPYFRWIEDIRNPLKKDKRQLRRRG